MVYEEDDIVCMFFLWKLEKRKISNSATFHCYQTRRVILRVQHCASTVTIATVKWLVIQLSDKSVILTEEEWRQQCHKVLVEWQEQSSSFPD
jgi:hypothetical protein